MEAAGRAVAHIVLQEFPDLRRRGALVVAGAGNNGGDGWVTARALHAGGVPVWVAALDPKTDDAIDNRALARVDGVREIGRRDPGPPHPGPLHPAPRPGPIPTTPTHPS